MSLLWLATLLRNPSWRLLPYKRILICLTKASIHTHLALPYPREGVTPTGTIELRDSLPGERLLFMTANHNLAAQR